jgi:hypothetical protein
MASATYEKRGLLCKRWGIVRSVATVRLTPDSLVMEGLFVHDHFPREEIAAVEVRRNAFSIVAGNLILRLASGRMRLYWWSDIDPLRAAFDATAWPLVP